MTKTKNTLIICAYVLLMTLFFFGGYTIGGVRRNEIAAAPTPVPVSVPAAAVNPRQQTRYRIILSNSELFLYKRDGEESELLYSHPIIEDIFPHEDMEELRRGVEFDNLHDAQRLLENFVS